MSIVVITIPGDAQKEFVNALHADTQGGIRLVIIQKPKCHSFMERLKRFYHRTDFPGVLMEAWYALLLRLSPQVRRALGYFQVPHVRTDERYSPPVMWVDSVNEDAVYEALKLISPDVLAVWGSAILERRIIATAKTAVNLHLGHSPQYRGALANQHAVLNEEYALIGATIHHMRATVDGGDILDQLTIDLSRPPHESFPALTTQARQRFIDVVRKLNAGETLPVRTQDTRNSNILLLRQWIPSVRYTVGKRILALEKTYSSYVKPVRMRYQLAVLGLVVVVLSGGGYALLNCFWSDADFEKGFEEATTSYIE